MECYPITTEGGGNMQDDRTNNEDATQSQQLEAPKSKRQTHDISEAFLVVLALLFGFGGGLLAQYADIGVNDNMGTIEQQREVLLQEGDVIANVAEQVGPSVVSISAEGEELSRSFFGIEVNPQESVGTGIILTSDGLVVTNKHVIPENLVNLNVVTSDGTVYDDVELIAKDPFTDIAYLQIQNVDDLEPIALGNSGSVRVGQRVIAIGNALGRFSDTVTSGIISGSGRPIIASDQSGGAGESLSNLFQTDAAINPGNSGGPLVDLDGKLIGINTAVAGNAENIGFAIPIDDVKAGIASVQANSELILPYLGVRYIPLNADIADRFNLNTEAGAYVFAEDGSSVLSDSPADKAGIENGDVILSIDGTEITADNPLPLIIGRKQVGDEVQAEILRDGDRQTLNVILEQAPEAF